MVVNMEALVDHRILGTLSYDLLKRLSNAVRTEQCNKAPITRSSFLTDRAMEKYGDWLRLQDIPQLIVRTQPTKDRSETARRRSAPDGAVPMTISRSVSEEIFNMDGVSSSPPAPLESVVIKRTPSAQSSVWKPIEPVAKYGLSHRSVLKVAERSFQA